MDLRSRRMDERKDVYVSFWVELSSITLMISPFCACQSAPLKLVSGMNEGPTPKRAYWVAAIAHSPVPVERRANLNSGDEDANFGFPAT
jgi:hypothetical protein